MSDTRFIVVHDAVVFRLNEMLEVGLDRLDGVFLADEVGCLLANHHLGGVRVAGHRARDDRRVGHTQTFDASHTASHHTHSLNHQEHVHSQ